MDEPDLAKILEETLSNPEELKKIQDMAAMLMGEGGGQEGEMLRNLASSLMGGGKEEESGKETEGGKDAILRAIAPYLREDRRERLRKSFRLAKLVHLAGSALKGFEGGGGLGI